MDIAADKKRQIVDAAIKRFSHFGVQKTTMSEIADDIQMSKANLYYYFPDKWSLVDAVADLLISEAEEEIQSAVEAYVNVEQLLIKALEIKMEYFNKYQMLIQNLNLLHTQDKRFKELSDRMFENERNATAKIFDIGVSTGELGTIDVFQKSNLYVTLLRGLGLYFYYDEPTPFLEVERLERIHKLQKEFVAVFVHGILKRN